MTRHQRKSPRTMLLTYPRTGTMWATERVEECGIYKVTEVTKP